MQDGGQPPDQYQRDQADSYLKCCRFLYARDKNQGKTANSPVSPFSTLTILGYRCALCFLIIQLSQGQLIKNIVEHNDYERAGINYPCL